MTHETIVEELRNAILQGDEARAVELGKIVIQEETSFRTAVDTAIETIRQVGDAFGTGEVFLPEMVMAADAMLAFMQVVAPHLERLTGRAQTSAKIVVGTVKGDIHSIGKDIMATMLRASGFEVIDMGVDVAPMEMIKSAEQSSAQIIGLSALMTTSMPYQKEVIELLSQLGKRDNFWVIVGGGPITHEYAQQIGANGWAANAGGAARLCERLLTSGQTPAAAAFVYEEK